MDRGAWWATVHGVTRDGCNLATKPPPQVSLNQNQTVGNAVSFSEDWREAISLPFPTSPGCLRSVSPGPTQIEQWQVESFSQQIVSELLLSLLSLLRIHFFLPK